MGPSDVEIRAYQKGDEKQIVHLLEFVFNGWPRPHIYSNAFDHWMWKYPSEPLFRNEIGVAVDNSRIVGCNHAMYYGLLFGGKEYLCRQGCDLAVHPDYQGQGIYKRINVLRDELRARNKGEIGYFTTYNPIVINRQKKEGTSKPIPYTVSTLVRIQDVDLHLKYDPGDDLMLRKIGYVALRTMNRLLRRRRKSDGDLELRNLPRFGSDVDKFFNEAKEQFLWVTKKDSEYLNWRFCDPRAGEFHVVGAYKGNALQGYIVFKLYHETEYPWGYIADFLSLPDREEVKASLIQVALEYFDERDVNVVTCLCVKNSSDYNVLKDSGFVDSRQENVIFYTIYDEGIDDTPLYAADPSQIHFTYSDLDRV